ncbi:hypothetical protein COOONC_18228 [Cooperia oncophora]
MSREWTWTDGSLVNYMKWSTHQPDDRNGRQRCAQVCYNYALHTTKLLGAIFPARGQILMAHHSCTIPG